MSSKKKIPLSRKSFTALALTLAMVFSGFTFSAADDAESPAAELNWSFETSEALPELLENDVAVSEGMASPLTTIRSPGPSATADPIYGNGSRSWNGVRALRIRGTHPAYGGASSTNLICRDLNIPVGTDTLFSYLILPDYSSYTSFDWEFTSQYIALDLEFSDGSRLSELGGTDQYGHFLTGAAQGGNKHLYSKQWNLVKCDLSKIAAGKTVSKIFVNYDKPDNRSGKTLNIDAYVDCVKIGSADMSPKATPVEYANIFVGNNDKGLYSRGLQWPAVMTPNGFNCWCPSNYPVTTWLGSSYTGNKIFTPYPDAGITHFTVSHQASLWIGDFGTFQFMPNTSHAPSAASILAPADRRALYDKDSMTANPAYFSVTFNRGSSASGVRTELSPTEHAAIVRMSFPEDSAYVNVLFDTVYATSGGRMTLAGNTFTAVTAHNSSEGRTGNMYIYGEFDKAPTALSKAYSPTTNARAVVNFPSGTGEVVMKLATSFISAEQAKRNLDLEIAGDASFDQVKLAAMETWNDVMNVIQVEGASEEEKVELYSNVYRLYADPLTLSENTGNAENPVWTYASPYAGSNSTTRTPKSGYKLYYNNGFWDTFRGSWTAYQLLTPEYSTTLLNGLAQHYVDSDWLARWLAPGGRNSMVGTSSDIIFGDAAAKGVAFDLEKAYMASLKNASAYAPYATSGSTSNAASYTGRAGMDQAPFLGYTANSTDGGKGLSWALDNYLNDLGVSVMAEKLGKTDEAVFFKNKALNYVNLWNYAGGGWFIGKTAAGAWSQPNGLTYAATGANSAYNRSPSDYEETNGFTMAWHALQDVQGLINLYGGKEKFTERLDRFFSDETQFSGGGRDYVLDHYDTKMGQYGQANQPDHHIPYMYAYAGQPYKTQALTREILDRVYVGYSFDQGFPGDADNGQQAGWYIMTMLGFYPFSNGADGYVITSPMHDKTTLNLPTGPIEILANNNSHDNVYIQSMTVDGAPYDSVYISRSDLLKAKKIVFEMGPSPSDWGKASAPPSITSRDDTAPPNPLKDFTTPGASISPSVPENTHVGQAAYATGLSAANTALLFNNTSSANVTFPSAKASVCYYFPDGKQVELYTVTSSSNLDGSAPSRLELLASDDGSDWKSLDRREDVRFDWARQTKPFALANDKAYNYYRLDLEAASGVSVSELEFMGYPVSIIKAPEKITVGGKGRFDVTVENSVSGLWFRDKDFNRLTDVTTSVPVLNADGTKTISVEIGADAGATYMTALDGNGYEIVASRRELAVSGLVVIRNGDSAGLRFTNATGKDMDLNLILGIYEPNGALAKVESKTLIVATGDAEELFLDISAYKGHNLKAFAWDSRFAPVCGAVSLGL
ncbi:MAG: GH92 family glycosyl hydrolase [Clostridiales Family XIII bacterium]|jgi:predicted alpha-1,2-mannosidase|nr:GH92 family glycosyl hydrolase [Clostridiales Family XIII bacterium]